MPDRIRRETELQKTSKSVKDLKHQPGPYTYEERHFPSLSHVFSQSSGVIGGKIDSRENPKGARPKSTSRIQPDNVKEKIDRMVSVSNSVEDKFFPKKDQYVA